MMADKTHYLIGKYGGAIPRYTSFPTAAQFSDAYNRKILDLIDLGVKRFSFGVQDFDEDVQAAINRTQPFSLVKSQVLFLKENGIHDINFDLITGLSDTDLIHRDIIMTLMCDFGIDLGRYPPAYIPNAQLEIFSQDGLIVYQNKKLKITDLGKPFTRVIAAAFDPYLSHQEQKHAKAI